MQCKIYEEWIEVMSDYSTVFSGDRRGVAENYYGTGVGASGGGEDEDGAGNATVILTMAGFSFWTATYL